jgi:hypothetical protein
MMHELAPRSLGAALGGHCGGSSCLTASITFVFSCVS